MQKYRQKSSKYQTFSSTTYISQNSLAQNVYQSKNQTSNYVSATFRIQSLFQKKLINKKRYIFQILKQFVLYPDTSLDSTLTVGRYDTIIFPDQKIHTLFKILQTQTIQNKIWAFLNLQFFRKASRVKQISQKIENIQHTIIIHNKRQAFYNIFQINQAKKKIQKLKTYALINFSFKGQPKYEKIQKVDSRISKRSLQTYHDQCGYKCHIECSQDYVQCSHCCCQNQRYDIQKRIQYLRKLQMIALALQLKQKKQKY